MSDHPTPPKQEEVERRIRAAAQRALKEAEARRKAAGSDTPRKREPQKRELGGRDGPEPVRYGDWEVKGIASDF
jgi:hypothetical protein